MQQSHLGCGEGDVCAVHLVCRLWSIYAVVVFGVASRWIVGRGFIGCLLRYSPVRGYGGERAIRQSKLRVAQVGASKKGSRRNRDH